MRYSAARRDWRARARIDAALLAAVARHMHLGEARDAVREPVPDPDGDALERRRGEAFDLVQQTVIELVLRVRHRRRQLVEMEDVARLRVGLAVDDDARAERVAVHARIRVAGRRARQEVRGLEMELFVDPHGAWNRR